MYKLAFATGQQLSDKPIMQQPIEETVRQMAALMIYRGES